MQEPIKLDLGGNNFRGPAGAWSIYIALTNNDPEAKVYVVGGAVRDHLFNHYHGKDQLKPKDVDLACNLSEEEILARLRSKYAKGLGIRVQEKQSVDTFGVAFVHVEGEGDFEVAPFRRDVGSADGRRPERVERATIYEDAMRRDLTINNLYWCFHTAKILDFNHPVPGHEHIKSKTVETVGDPFERFAEDKLRILRMVRFFSRYSDGKMVESISAQTKAAIEKFADLRSHGISGERITTEFLAGLKQCVRTDAYLTNLLDLRLLPTVFEGLMVAVGNIGRLGDQRNPHVVMAMLLHLNKGDRKVADHLTEKLKYPSDVADQVQFLVNCLNFDPDKIVDLLRVRDRKLLRSAKRPLTDEEQTQNSQTKWETLEELVELYKICPDSSVAVRVLHFCDYKPPFVNGEDLMRQGFVGPAIGIEQKRIVRDDYQKSFDTFYDMKRKDRDWAELEKSTRGLD